MLRPVVLFLNPLHSSLPYLFDIASGSLTEHCCSHLLWLCYSAESGLITSLCCVKWWSRTTLSTYTFCQSYESLYLTFTLYHTLWYLSRGFLKNLQLFLEKAFVQEKVQFLFTSCRLGFLHRPNLLTHTSYPS